MTDPKRVSPLAPLAPSAPLAALVHSPASSALPHSMHAHPKRSPCGHPTRRACHSADRAGSSRHLALTCVAAIDEPRRRCIATSARSRLARSTLHGEERVDPRQRQHIATGVDAARGKGNSAPTCTARLVTPTPIESTANWAVSFEPSYMMVVFAGLQWVRPRATTSFGH